MRRIVIQRSEMFIISASWLLNQKQSSCQKTAVTIFVRFVRFKENILKLTQKEPILSKKNPSTNGFFAYFTINVMCIIL